jgi:hypothetical protein
VTNDTEKGQLRYLQAVVASTSVEVARLFGWQPGDVERLASRLAQDGRMQAGVHIEGLEGEYLVSVA